MIVPVIIGTILLFYSLRENDMESFNINGESFRIQMRDDVHISKKIANDLYDIKQKVSHLIRHLQESSYADPKRKEAVERLIKKYKGVIHEIPKDKTGKVAYNDNKGDAIALCMYKDGIHQDKNTAVFVTLHELAHCMTVKYRHDAEFWNNFKFILKESIHLGIYKYQDFTSKSENFCGMEISNTPYKI